MTETEAPIFYQLFKTLLGKTVSLELKSGQTLTGTLANVDDFLNLNLEQAAGSEDQNYVGEKNPKNTFVRGTSVTYAILKKSDIDIQLLEDTTRKMNKLQL